MSEADRTQTPHYVGMPICSIHGAPWAACGCSNEQTAKDAPRFLVPMVIAGSLCGVAWLIVTLAGHADASMIGGLALFCFGVFLGKTW